MFMLVDDWGWANAGFYRDPPTPEVVTPNIDNLVKEGLELDQHYVFKLCSPSRCSLLTGRVDIKCADYVQSCILCMKRYTCIFSTSCNLINEVT